VTAPDFEIKGRLRAQSVDVHVQPEAETKGEGVSVSRQESRRGVPAKLEAGGRYRDVDIEKQLIGEQTSKPETDAAGDTE
jgi:hypothetical protein